jgi:iron complex outermembrane receptor protein
VDARRSHYCLGGLGCLIVMVPIAASAVVESDPDSQTGQLLEVTVTATRREEPLQRVPVAVSVLSGNELEAQNLNNLEDVSSVLPAVGFRTGASNKDRDIFVRGIGTITTSPGVDPSVATVIDGVVLARPGQATVELLDIDRIEVLRGPQGTLFGKNASAGVVNMVTSDPQQVSRGYIDGAYFGGGGEYRLKGGVSGALLADQVLGSISAVYSRYGGNVDNLANGATLNGYEHSGAHVKLLLKSSDSLRVTLNADYMRSIDTVPTGIPSASGQVAYPTNTITPNPAFAAVLAAAGVVPSLQSSDVSQNVNSRVRDENGGVSVVADYTWNDFTLTSVTAWRRWQNEQRQDYDQVSQLAPGFPAVRDQGDLAFHQISEETRIASPEGRLIDYQAGVYFLHTVDAETYQRDVAQLGMSGESLNSGTAVFGTSSNNYSIFGEGNLKITARLRALLGARIVTDELSYQLQRVSTSPVAVSAILPSFSSSGTTHDRGYTGRAGLQYELNPDLQSYVTYSRGYSGPAYNIFFNMSAPATAALRPETSSSYELGFKSHAANQRLQANVALFLTYFDNYKANFPDDLNGALVTRLINAGGVSTRGVELDFAYRPRDALTLSGAAAATRARVDTFNCPAAAGPGCNINGEPLPFAPDWKLNIDARYVIQAGGSLQWVLASDFQWQSRVQYQLTETADTTQGAYGIWNASVALADELRGWSVRALVKNITATSYSEYLAHGDFAGLMRWVPRDASRYAGIDIRKSF